MSASPRLAVPASRWVTFTLEGQRYALPLESVHRALRAVEITPLPLAPDAVAGAIDVGGRTLPVFSLVLALPDGMVFIEDLECFLSPEEDRALDSALREAGVDRAR